MKRKSDDRKTMNTHFRFALSSACATARIFITLWVICAVFTIGAYSLSMSMPAMADVTWREAGQVGTSFFLLACGAPWYISEIEISLLPLLLTFTLLIALRAALRRRRIDSWAELGAAVATAIITVGIISFFAWQSAFLYAIIGSGILTFLAGVSAWWATRPPRPPLELLAQTTATVATSENSSPIPHVLHSEQVSQKEDATLSAIENAGEYGGVSGNNLPEEMTETVGFSAVGDVRPLANTAQPSAPASRGYSLRMTISRIYDYFSTCYVIARPVIAACIFLAVILCFIAAIHGWQRMSSIHEAYQLTLLPSLFFIILQILYIPTYFVWALSYASGVGFYVGQESFFSPHSITLAPLPAIPALGALPEPQVKMAWIIIIPMLIGLVITLWLMPRWDSLVGALTRVPGVALILFPVFSVCGLFASGSIGPNRLAHIGINFQAFSAALTAEIIAGVLLGMLIFHPQSRSWQMARMKQAFSWTKTRIRSQSGQESSFSAHRPTVKKHEKREKDQTQEKIEDVLTRAQEEALPPVVPPLHISTSEMKKTEGEDFTSPSSEDTSSRS